MGDRETREARNSKGNSGLSAYRANTRKAQLVRASAISTDSAVVSRRGTLAEINGMDDIREPVACGSKTRREIESLIPRTAAIRPISERQAFPSGHQRAMLDQKLGATLGLDSDDAMFLLSGVDSIPEPADRRPPNAD